jgi:hypothetical protein
MREHRWETQSALSFDQILKMTDRLRGAGLTPADPEKDVITYIEDWEVSDPQDILKLEFWPIEDLTLIHVLEQWEGDFFLLVGRYHTVFQRYQSVNTYCSVCHPWRIEGHLATLLPDAMFWVGFRHTHSFIRVRVHTTDIVAPGETWADQQRLIWLEERQAAFLAAIRILDLPLEPAIERDRLTLRTPRQDTPLFCSWPDAFGPCQFEFNSPDVFEFLVPASQLAATYQSGPATVRTYLTGFSGNELQDFQSLEKNKRSVYRCSAHNAFKDIPDILAVLERSGRLYSTLCEFQTDTVLPEGKDVAAIIGVVATQGQFRLEVRLSQSPLTREGTTEWLEGLLGMPVSYDPLSAFP